MESMSAMMAQTKRIAHATLNYTFSATILDLCVYRHIFVVILAFNAQIDRTNLIAHVKVLKGSNVQMVSASLALTDATLNLIV